MVSIHLADRVPPSTTCAGRKLRALEIGSQNVAERIYKRLATGIAAVRRQPWSFLMVLAGQKRTEESVVMSETAIYKLEKLVSSGEPSVKLLLGFEVNDYHLWFKRRAIWMLKS